MTGGRRVGQHRGRRRDLGHGRRGGGRAEIGLTPLSLPPRTMPSALIRFSLAAVSCATVVSVSAAQQADNSRAMHWRQIGPTRAGRARALAGVPSQPNVFYAGFDNGGVWRSTDY